MISHEDLLNKIMANTCPIEVNDKDKSIVKFEYDLHCGRVCITAKTIINVNEKTDESIIRYEIIDYIFD